MNIYIVCGFVTLTAIMFAARVYIKEKNKAGKPWTGFLKCLTKP